MLPSVATPYIRQALSAITQRHNIIWSIVTDLNIVPRDTTLEAIRIQFSILRKIGFAGRANVAIELSDGLRATIQSGVQQRHPEYNDNMIRLAALQLAIGEQLFHQAPQLRKHAKRYPK